ncbi:hypothetical protein HZS_2024 [Henneguya salminicola]|nr:hypothetical protein HZS_2024 [Henneguya salminicola]
MSVSIFLPLLCVRGLMKCSSLIESSIVCLLPNRFYPENNTILFCCPRSGKDKINPLGVGRASNPRSFKNIRSLSYTYRDNNKAWTTQAIFGKGHSLINFKIKKA